MIFYRLGIQKFIEYFKPFQDEERRQMLMGKKKKELPSTKLKANPTMDLCISTLLSIITALVCLSIPFNILESPCEMLKDNDMLTLYNIAKFLEKYVKMIDRLIIALSIILVVVTITTLVDAISRLDTNISPWIEKGKYSLPKNQSKSNRRRIRYHNNY